jgi:hypothetical protein
VNIDTEKKLLTEAMAAATSTSPLIVRHVLFAQRLSKPYAERKVSLAQAIQRAGELKAALERAQAELGWADRGSST